MATVKSPTWGDKARKVPAGGCFLAITAQSDEQIQAAWEFEKYLYSVESMAAWTIGTGYVPPRKDVADAENGLKSFLAENEMMNAAIEQMDGVVSWTSSRRRRTAGRAVASGHERPDPGRPGERG